MSTNGIYGQMQTWLQTHGENMETYSSTLSGIDSELDKINEELQGELTQKEARELSQRLNELEVEYLQAELDYLNETKEAGKYFDFMEGDYDISDAKTFIPAYAEQTGKLAQGDMDAWEQDGKEGVSLEEYTLGQLGSKEDSALSKEEYSAASKYAKETFEGIDINGNGTLEKNELQGFYAALDNADGSVNGKIDIDSTGVDFTSKKFQDNIKSFQKYLEE